MRTASETLAEAALEPSKDLLCFRHLPDFCRFLLDHHLEDFSRQQLQLAFELEVPLMKLLANMPEEQLNALARQGIIELFENIIAGTTAAYLEKSNEDWRNNRIPVLSIDQSDVVSEDITLVGYARKQGFLKFLPLFTKDLERYGAIVSEVDRFTLYSETLSFRTYAEILTKQLRHNESLYKQAQAISRLGNWTWDVSTNSIVWTDELYRIFGLKPQSEKISFERYLNLIHPEDREEATKQITQSLQEKKAFEFYHRTMLDDGRVRIIHSKGEVLLNDNGDVAQMMGTGQDITEDTERKKNEARLRESEERFRSVADSAPVLIWMSNREGERNYFNKGWLAFTGAMESDALGTGWKSFLHPDDLPQFEQAYNASVKAQQQFSMEYRLKRNDGEFRWMMSTGVPRYDGSGEFIGFIGTVVDIDERKRVRELLEHQVKERTAALERANQELQRSNKELLSFSYVASHDLQEPLRKIQTFGTRVLERDYENLSQSGRDSLARMNDAASRMKQLIEDLLQYSRINAKTKEPEPVDLNVILTELQSANRDQYLEHNVSISSDALPTIHGIPYQLTQLFENLIGNSVKYRKPDVPPAIRISHQVVSGDQLPEETLAHHGSYHKITVEDNGIGFEPKHAHRIFEVFQRLHNRDEYSGTGIGLSICKKIMENHHGFISAMGTSGVGASFTLYFPSV